MKRNAFALGCFFLVLAVVLSAHRSSTVTTAALLTATASPTATSPKPTGTSPRTASPFPTLTPEPTMKALGALVQAALDKNETLESYRADVLMSVLVEGAMQANSPLKFFDMQVERMGADTHVVSAGVLPAPGEFIKVGDQLYVRDVDNTGSERWIVVPRDQWSDYLGSFTPLQAAEYFLAGSRNFSQEGVETLDGLRCEVYLQDRAGVVRFVLAFYAIGGNLPEGAEESLDESLDVAETRVWVCEDGYLHQIKMQVTGSDLTIDGHFKLADLNGDIKIVAPPNPIVPPSSTPVPSETPVWTATPRATLSAAQATATATAALDALDATTDWEVVLADTFDSNSNNWTVEEGKSIENGKYTWNMNDRVNIYRGLPEIAGQTDFAASIDARLVGGSQDCGMGLTFRNGIDDISGGMTDYVFYIQNDGSWGFDIIHSPDPGIAQTGTSDAIVPRALNRLQVLAQGNQLTFFVNGKFVGQAEDDTLPIGKAGAAVWVLGPGGCEVEFDNFQVSAAPPPDYITKPGKIIFTDWTAANPNEWPTGSYQKEDAAGTREIVGTKYVWEASSYSELEVVATPAMEPATDFDVSVDAQQTSGGAKTHYGFIVRHTAPDSWYEFAVTGYGSFTISSTLTDEYKVLNFGTPSSAIKIGEVNHLRLIGAGSQFTFYINDEVIAIVNDETLAEGTVGVMVEAYDKENPGATFEFSNFVLRELPTQAAAPGTPPAPPAATPAATPGAAD